jgi:SUMO ligase MMS21 Smc5/6 complex component
VRALGARLTQTLNLGPSWCDFSHLEWEDQTMRTSRFSDQQIALTLQQVEHEASVAEVCRKLGIAEQTYYRWKKRSLVNCKEIW